MYLSLFIIQQANYCTCIYLFNNLELVKTIYNSTLQFVVQIFFRDKNLWINFYYF